MIGDPVDMKVWVRPEAVVFNLIARRFCFDLVVGEATWTPVARQTDEIRDTIHEDLEAREQGNHDQRWTH